MTEEYVRISRSKLEALADEIAIKSYAPVGLTVDQMITAVQNIRPALQPIAISESDAERMIYPGVGYDGIESVSVNITAQDYSRPEITVDENGLVTVTAEQEGGIITGGTYTYTFQLDTVDGITVTPGDEEQLVVPAGSFVTGDIIVEAIGENENGPSQDDGMSEEVLEITTNGVYDVSGYGTVIVNVQTPNL